MKKIKILPLILSIFLSVSVTGGITVVAEEQMITENVITESTDATNTTENAVVKQLIVAESIVLDEWTGGDFTKKVDLVDFGMEFGEFKGLFINDITDIQISSGVYADEYVTFKDDEKISMFNTSAYKMNYVVDSSVKNVSNEYLGISDNFAIRKINLGETYLYSVAVKTREEMIGLFETSSELYKDGKIKEAYSLMNIGYSPILYDAGECKWVTLDISCSEKIVTYLNNELLIIVEGDINGDNELNVRDCADLASIISQNKSDNISNIADFNIDGKVNVRDAASIAKYLAWPW